MTTNSEIQNSSNKVSKIKKYTALFIVAIVAVTMLGFGLVDFAGSGSDYVIKVKDKKITPAKFDQMLESQKKQYVYRFGIGIVESFLNTPEFKNLFLNQAIDNLLISLFLEDNGVVINKKTIDDFTVQNPIFQDIDGNFDKNKYTQYLTQLGLSEEEYIAEQIQSISLQFVSEIFSINNVTFIDNLASLKVREQKENREIKIKEFPVNYSTNFNVEEEEIVSFYNQNNSQFLKPEERKIIFANLNQNSINFNPSQKEILSQYRKDYLYKNQKITFYKLSFSSKEEAEKVLNIIKNNNQPLVDFAKQSLGLQVKDILFKSVNYSDLSEEFKVALSQTSQSQISNIFFNNNSYNITQLVSVSKSKSPPLNQVKQNIISALKKQHACTLVNQMARRLNDELESGAEIKDAVNTQLKLQTTLISKDRNDFNFSASIIDQILSNSDTYYGNIVPVKECEYLIYKIEDIIESQVEDLNTIKGGILDLIYKEKSRSTTQQKAEKFYNKIMKGNQNFSGKSISIEKSTTILPENIVQLIFSSKVGDIIPPFINNDQNKFILVQVTKLENLDDVTFSPEELKNKIEEIRKQRKEEFTLSFMEELRQKYKIKVNYNYL